MWTREQLKMNGKQLFYRNYWNYVAVTLLAGLFAGAGGGSASYSGRSSFAEMNDATSGYGYRAPSISPEAGMAFAGIMGVMVVVMLIVAIALLFLGIFVGNVLLVGDNVFYIKNRTERAGIKTMLEPFRSGHYGNVVLTMFLMELYIFLWSLLFIIPGIIKTYEYLMVPYILAENPGMDRKEAFAISRRMMEGQKWDAFVLALSFLGWGILSIFTCGILGIFFLNPYTKATFTELYAYNKVKAYNEGYIR